MDWSSKTGLECTYVLNMIKIVFKLCLYQHFNIYKLSLAPIQNSIFKSLLEIKWISVRGTSASSRCHLAIIHSPIYSPNRVRKSGRSIGVRKTENDQPCTKLSNNFTLETIHLKSNDRPLWPNFNDRLIFV